MDALATATSDTAKPLSRTARAVIVGVVLLVLALDLGERATLVDSIPFPLTFASGAAFFAAGVWLSFSLKPPPYVGPVRRVMAHIAAPILALFIGTFLARTTVEAGAFARLSPISMPAEAVVTGKSSGKWDRHIATVSFGSDTRDVDVEITTDLYDRLDPYRAPGRDCLELSMETGRWGIRRTMLPRRFFDRPIGADRYVQCPQKQDGAD